MTTVTRRSPGDHVCWPFHGMDGLVKTARDYVAEGVNRNERVTFWKVGPSDIRHAVVSDVGEVGLPPSADLPVLTPLRTEPDWKPWSNPVRHLGMMTDEALADGYTGLRVLTDATSVARHPATREDWVHSEHLIDRFCLDHRVTVLCGYDVDLGDGPLAQVACVHALTGQMPSPFLLRAADSGGRLSLTGEVDRGSAAALHDAIIAIAPGTSGPLVLDVTEHDFIDHTGLVALHRAALVLGTQVHIVGASTLTALLVDAFGLTGVSVLEASS